MASERLTLLAIGAAIDVDKIILGRFGNSSTETNLEPLKDWLCETVRHFKRCGIDPEYQRLHLFDKRQPTLAEALDYRPDPEKNFSWPNYFDELISRITIHLCTLQAICHDPLSIFNHTSLAELRGFCVNLSKAASAHEPFREFRLAA
ncbi:MAG: hypothetical protein Athens101428_568 [Candidatus Berkelbacteria bacterium Athens1014_28]|uniref:Uncharacterized protein n=1 Tax=Candidatus Berkelbacteria bacterium Athens1014_28 TaxID=2017145 RepID=A0A554LM60_9BACT|nr:MAG: hypothetical protein Athens101428_568 [Candidatus Berkelbacteria bacterium Athens1014_28]